MGGAWGAAAHGAPTLHPRAGGACAQRGVCRRGRGDALSAWGGLQSMGHPWGVGACGVWVPVVLGTAVLQGVPMVHGTAVGCMGCWLCMQCLWCVGHPSWVGCLWRMGHPHSSPFTSPPGLRASSDSQPYRVALSVTAPQGNSGPARCPAAGKHPVRGLCGVPSSATRCMSPAAFVARGPTLTTRHPGWVGNRRGSVPPHPLLLATSFLRPSTQRRWTHAAPTRSFHGIKRPVPAASLPRSLACPLQPPGQEAAVLLSST